MVLVDGQLWREGSSRDRLPSLFETISFTCLRMKAIKCYHCIIVRTFEARHIVPLTKRLVWLFGI